MSPTVGMKRLSALPATVPEKSARAWISGGTGWQRHFPSTPAVTMPAMFVARLICSDSDCAEEQEVHAASLAELERLLCECGCALELIAWPDWAEDSAQVIALRARPSRASLPAAA